ncbi:GNAT family N-acetyltransferase [Asticcacaulis sp. W401b]|uniref:GNAT family N-acetyltransferase n=1 Tax=Asticcacaulis sp. W401b TaxID=3388666 RepID=UPI0039704AB7
MQSETTFERVHSSDADRLHAMAGRIYHQHYADLWEDRGAQYLRDALSVEKLRDELSQPQARFFYIQSRLESAGFIKFNLPAESGENDGLYLERLYLDEAFTGRSLGKLGLQFAEQQAIELGIERVWLKAMAYRDDVCRFYARHGYTACGESTLSFPKVVHGRTKMITFEKRISRQSDAT